MPTTNITPETLRAQAALGGDSLREFILGDSKNRADRVARATEALRMFRAEMQNDPVEQRKAVVDTTRVILQGSLEEIRAELTEANPEKKKTLETELQAVDQTKASALKDEQEMATTTEFVTSEVREVFNETKTGDWMAALKYGGAAAVAGVAAHWLWERTIGAASRWFRGSEGKPGWLEKSAKWLTTAAAMVGGVLGIRALTRSPVGKAIKDTGEGIAKEGDATRKEVSETMEHNAEFYEKLQESKGWLETMKVAVADGLPLVWENGSLMIWLGVGKPVTLIGGTLAKAKEWAESGEQPDDFWLLFGQAMTATGVAAGMSAATGTVYFVGGKAMNALVYGRLDLPKTGGGMALTALKIASGPIGPALDLARTGYTAMRPNGRQALRIRYMTHAFSGTRQFMGGMLSRANRTIEWARYGTQIPESNVEAALRDWADAHEDAKIIDQFSKVDGDLFTKDQAADAKTRVDAELARLQLAIRKIQSENGHSQPFRKLRAKVRGSATSFESAALEYVGEVEQRDAEAAPDAQSETERQADNVADQDTTETDSRAAGVPAAASQVTPQATPASPTVPIQPSAGPVRVQVARVQPGPGPQRVQGVPAAAAQQEAAPAAVPNAAPQVPTPGPDAEPDLTLAPAEPRAVTPDVQEAIDRSAMVDADGDELAPAEPVDQEASEPATDADYELAPVEDGELRLQDAIARPPVSLEVELPVAPEPTAQPSPTPVMERRRPGGDGDAAGPALTVNRVPRTPPSSGSLVHKPAGPAPIKSGFTLSEKDIDADLRKATAKAPEGDADLDNLIEEDGDGSPIADAAALTPPSGDASDIARTRTSVDAVVDGATDVDGKASSKPSFKGRR